MKVFNTIEECMELVLDDHPFGGRPWVLGEGEANPDILLVKAVPSFSDLKGFKPFLGEDGILIRHVMMELNLKPYYLAGVPFVPKDGKVKIADARKFSSLITRTIRETGAKNILLFGADAVRMTNEFAMDVKKLSDVQGKVWEWGDLRFLVFPHTSILNRNLTMIDRIRDDVQRMMYPGSLTRPHKVAAEYYHVHTTRESVEALLPHVGEVVACDIETTGLDPRTDKILTVQLSWEEGTGHSIRWDLLTPEEWAELLGPRKLIFQNGTFDAHVLAVNGVRVNIYEDTMLMHSLIDETPGTHSMDDMALRYLGIEKWSDMVEYDAMEEVDELTLGKYGARDADITLRLANLFRDKTTPRRIHTVLHDAQNAVTDSEVFGVRVDRDKAFQFQREVEKALHDRQQYIEDVYGLANPNSPQQVAKLLYEDMGLPVKKLKGRITTNEDALMSFDNVPVVNDILEYRQLTKVNGTYLRKILEASEFDGRYHPQFKLAATETGRLAESLILLIPRAEEVSSFSLGKEYQYRLRELFIPDDGHLMIGADFSGLEIAMAAHITADVRLIQDVKNMVDTHSVVAIEAFGLDIPLEPYSTLKARVQEEHSYERSVAKAGVFAWLYGGDANTIARNLGISKDSALSIFDTLTSLYGGVSGWHKLIHAKVQEDMVVSTPWGRRRHFIFNGSMSRSFREDQLRESTNMPIQGMGTDMNLAAFYEIWRSGIRTLFPFHDAIYAQSPEHRAEEDAKKIKEIMESVLDGPVPFRADVDVGRDWGELG